MHPLIRYEFAARKSGSSCFRFPQATALAPEATECVGGALPGAVKGLASPQGEQQPCDPYARRKQGANNA